jgi:hypothetical protein
MAVLHCLYQVSASRHSFRMSITPCCVMNRGGCLSRDVPRHPNQAFGTHDPQLGVVLLTARSLNTACPTTIFPSRATLILGWICSNVGADPSAQFPQALYCRLESTA